MYILSCVESEKSFNIEYKYNTTLSCNIWLTQNVKVNLSYNFNYRFFLRGQGHVVSEFM